MHICSHLSKILSIHHSRWNVALESGRHGEKSLRQEGAMPLKFSDIQKQVDTLLAILTRNLAFDIAPLDMWVLVIDPSCTCRKSGYVAHFVASTRDFFVFCACLSLTRTTNLLVSRFILSLKTNSAKSNLRSVDLLRDQVDDVVPSGSTRFPGDSTL